LIERSKPAPMQPIAADLGLAQYRRVVDELLAAERASVERASIPVHALEHE